MSATDLTSRLLKASEKLAESVAFDMNGNLIGGKWMGGHGGLISQETMQAADEVRRVASALRASGEKP